MTIYDLSDFDTVPSAKEIVTGNVALDALPTVEQVKTLARWTPEMLDLFNRDADWFSGAAGDKQDRSAALMRLAYSGAEMGWEDNQIAAALYDADSRWGKYLHRRDRDKRLIDFVNRARAKVGYTQITEIDISRFTKPTDSSVVVTPDRAAEPLVWGFQDFVDAEFKVNWLLNGLLAQGGIGLVTGYPGTGKTQFAIQLGAYLSLGYNKFLKWDNTGSAKKVLFLSLEMSKPPLNLFMNTIGESYPDKQALNRNFLVAPLGQPIPFDTKEGQAFLNNLLDEYMPDVIFIDSLQRSISKEMTDELAAKNLMHYLAVVREKYRCAIVMIHHNRKKSNEATAKQIAQLSDVYGSVFFTADVDFVLSLDKLTPGMLNVHTLKNRLGPEREPFEIIRDSSLHFSSEFENLANQFPTEPTSNIGVLDV